MVKSYERGPRFRGEASDAKPRCPSCGKTHASPTGDRGADHKGPWVEVRCLHCRHAWRTRAQSVVKEFANV